MISTIVNAMKISLAECKQYQDPATYIHELNQVLNRYKTNIFKLTGDKEKMLYDPKELINFRLYTSWRTRPTFRREATIVERFPIMLHASGFIPRPGERRNFETTHSLAVDVSDIIDLDKIASLKTDYYQGLTVTTNSNYITEDKILENTLGLEAADQCSMYFTAEKAVDEVINFSFQLNSFVYSSVINEHQLKSAASMAGDVQKTQRRIDIEARQEEERARLAKQVTGPGVTEVIRRRSADYVDEPRVPVNDFFGAPQRTAPSPVPPLRSKGLGGKQKAVAVPRKRHNFW